MRIPILKKSRKSYKKQAKDEDTLLQVTPIRKLIKIVQEVPGFKKQLVLKKLVRIIKEPTARRMGMKVAKRLAKRNAVRFVKVVTSEA